LSEKHRIRLRILKTNESIYLPRELCVLRNIVYED